MTLTAIVFILSLCTVTYLIHNYVALPRSIPGPTLACFTDFWRAYKQRTGQLRSELVQLHAKHGPIVRYGIRSISISTPEAIEVIYGSRAGFTTADSYSVLIGISNGKEVPSLVSTKDETRHGQLRRSVAGAFTVRGAEDYEKYVDATVSDLLEKLRKSDSGTFDLSDLLMLYSMDSAARQAFGEPLGCLETGADVDGSIELIRERFRHWGAWSSVPWLERLYFRNPWSMRQSHGKAPSAMVSRAAQILKLRMQDGKHADGDDMLHKFMKAHDANPGIFDAQAIVSLVMSTISGAGDTTSNAITAIMYFLIKNPREQAKLRAELAQAGIEKGTIPHMAATAKLPYLAATIKEAMRLFSSPTWPIERLVPAGGIHVAGQAIPEGTSVGIFPSALHLRKEVFGDDAAEFRPSRWIEADDQKHKAMESAFMGFSRGRRVCLGQHVAQMQMKKVVPILLLNFELSFMDKDATLDADFRPAVPVLKPLMVRIVPKD